MVLYSTVMNLGLSLLVGLFPKHSPTPRQMLENPANLILYSSIITTRPAPILSSDGIWYHGLLPGKLGRADTFSTETQDAILCCH
jgi:hypothetical protein